MRDLGNAWNNVLFVSACESRGSEADKNRGERDEKMYTFLKTAGGSGLQLSSPLVHIKASS